MKSEFTEIDEHGVEHSVIGASSMYRVEMCPRSVSLHRELLKTGWKSKSSDAANKGTAMHHFIEEMFTQDLDPDEMQGTFHAPTKYTLTKADCANLKWVKKQIEKIRKDPEWEDAELKLETKLHLSSVHEGAFGTNDIALVNPFGRAYLLDYKDGTSKVGTIGNRQLAYYGVGLQDEDGCYEVVTSILQPNVTKTVEQYVLTSETLEEERVRLKDAIEKAMDPNAPLCEGSHCFFCPAKQARTCPLILEKEKQEKESLLLPVKEEEGPEWTPVKLDSASLTPVDELTDQQRATLLVNKKLLEDYLKQVYDYSMQIFEDHPLKGFTITEGRQGNREWVSGAEDHLKGLVKDEILFEIKLASPTLLEKRLGSDFVKIPSDLVLRKEGQKKLVAIADPATPKLKKPKTK